MSFFKKRSKQDVEDEKSKSIDLDNRWDDKEDFITEDKDSGLFLNTDYQIYPEEDFSNGLPHENELITKQIDLSNRNLNSQKRGNDWDTLRDEARNIYNQSETKERRAKYSAKIDNFLNNGIIIVGILLLGVLLIAFLV